MTYSSICIQSSFFHLCTSFDDAFCDHEVQWNADGSWGDWGSKSSWFYTYEHVEVAPAHPRLSPLSTIWSHSTCWRDLLLCFQSLQMPFTSNDLLLILPARSFQHQQLQDGFVRSTSELRVPLGKTKDPWLHLTFIDIDLYTSTCCRWFPVAKLSALVDRLQDCLLVRKLMLHQTQELAGHLKFAYKVVIPGKAFLTWWHDAAAALFTFESWWRYVVTCLLG